MKKEIAKLKGYAAKSDKTKDTKSKVLENVKLLYGGIKKDIKGFEDGDFQIKGFGKQIEDKQHEQSSTSKDGQESEEFEESEESEKSEKDEKV